MSDIRSETDYVEAELIEGEEQPPHAEQHTAAESTDTEAIDVVGGCTSCHPDRFFSHRRDAGRTGRHLSWISPLP